MNRNKTGKVVGKTFNWRALFLMLAVPALFAQQKSAAPLARNPFQSQSASTVGFSVKGGSQTIEIVNSSYEVTGSGVPGRPTEEMLLLRKTTRTKEVVDEIGMEANTTVEAWPLGVDPTQKPLYSLKVSGIDCRTVDNNLLVVLRGLEEVQWWSVYKLGSGAHLFDTYVPLVEFSISREVQELRYVGLEVPPDDTADARLKDPHVVGVLIYSSADAVLQEALITSDDPKRAAILRSYADATRTVTIVENGNDGANEKVGASRPNLSVSVAIKQNYPSAPSPVTMRIPISAGNLDLKNAMIPEHLHLAAWNRYPYAIQ
jgi:hypothetical protein